MRAGTTPPTASACSTPRSRPAPIGSSTSTPTSASTPTTPRRCGGSSAPTTPCPGSPTASFSTGSGGRARSTMPPRSVYRLFAAEPGQRIEGDRLHFTPVPASIPRGARIPTTIRARHLDSEARLADRLAKYEQADPEGDEQPNALLVEPAGEPARWGPRPAGLDVLAPWDGALSSPAADAPRTLTCLLPARNAAADLHGWLESAARFADSVIALDDGSTDDTAARLEAHPLVDGCCEIPSARPMRAGTTPPTASACSTPRSRPAPIGSSTSTPTSASTPTTPRRCGGSSAEGPRTALHTASGSSAWARTAPATTGRRCGSTGCSARQPGQALPERRLHLVPVPTSIARESWERTTIRIQHFAGATEERRRARYAKYREADPGRASARVRLAARAAGGRAPWQPRPAGLAGPRRSARRGSPRSTSRARPGRARALGRRHLARRRGDDRGQRPLGPRPGVGEPFEVILVVSGSDGTAEHRAGPLPRGPARRAWIAPGSTRGGTNAGLALARGDYVWFPGSHVELPAGSFAARLRAHRAAHPLVTGTRSTGPTPGGVGRLLPRPLERVPGRPSAALRAPCALLVPARAAARGRRLSGGHARG